MSKINTQPNPNGAEGYRYIYYGDTKIGWVALTKKFYHVQILGQDFLWSTKAKKLLQKLIEIQYKGIILDNARELGDELVDDWALFHLSLAKTQEILNSEIDTSEYDYKEEAENLTE